MKKLASKDDARTDEQKVTDLYFTAFSRPPTSDELAKTLTYIHRQVKENIGSGQAAVNREAGYEDLLWVLFNTKEFLFNH